MHLLSLGTRKVYAPSAAPLAEDSPLGPSDAYGRHKLALEQALHGVLGPGLTPRAADVRALVEALGTAPA